MLRNRRWLALLGLLLSFSLVAAACGDDDTDADTGDDTTDDTTDDTGDTNGDEAASGDIDFASCSGTATGSGASFPSAVYAEEIAAFQSVAPDLEVTYNSIGSGSGKEEFGQGLNDWAGSDSLVGEDDGPDPGSYLYVPSTASAVTISYNLSDVEELRLSAEVIADIFQRNITSWDDPAIAELNDGVELPSQDIIVAHRSDGSGTTANFTAYLVDAAPNWELGSDDVVDWPADTQAGPQNTGVAQIVQDNEGAIGYVDIGDASIIGLQTALVENSEGEYVAPTIEGIQEALAGAELSDELTFNPLNAPGAESYPITAPTYILLRTEYDQETYDAVECWLTWHLTEGLPEIGPEIGFAPLPDALLGPALGQLDEVEITG